MVELQRTVRFCINPPDARSAPIPATNADGADFGDGGKDTVPTPSSTPNGFAGVPAMRGLGRYYELDLVCQGEADPVTGYLINIKDVDRAARGAVIPLIEKAVHDTPWVEPASLMERIFALARSALRVGLVRVRWRLTPTYSVEMAAPSATSPGTHVVMRQRFDFAAAHRLHVPDLSDAENRATFGRCNNPSGHGHNYMIEPAVAFDPDGPPFTVADLERLTHEAIIDPFDHTHLNKDTAPFAETGGLNPSVENIARVFFALLKDRLARERKDVTLASMTVWETDRTSCIFSG